MLDKTRPKSVLTVAQAKGHLKRALDNLADYLGRLSRARKDHDQARVIRELELKVTGLNERVATRKAVLADIEAREAKGVKFGVNGRRRAMKTPC